MTITFENNNDVIVYALEMVISHARRTQEIFAAQWVWWQSSIIRIEQGLVDYIDSIQIWKKVSVIPEKDRVTKRTASL